MMSPLGVGVRFIVLGSRMRQGGVANPYFLGQKGGFALLNPPLLVVGCSPQCSLACTNLWAGSLFYCEKIWQAECGAFSHSRVHKPSTVEV